MKNLTRAAELVCQLQAWIEDRDGLSSVPVAHLSYGANDVLEIAVGNTTVWSSEIDDQEDFTLEYCQAAWLESVAELQPFWDECLTGTDRPPDGWTEMRCGQWVEEDDMMRHARTCRRCRDDEAADRADMAHSDGDTLPGIALEAAAEDAYLRQKHGGREGPDPLDPSQDPRNREL